MEDEKNISEKATPRFTPMAMYHLRGMVIWLKISSISAFVFGGGILLFVTRVIIQGDFDEKVVVTLFMGVLSVVLGSYLISSANRFLSFSENYNTEDLESGLAKQKNYWMIIGVLVIIQLAFLVIWLSVGGWKIFFR